MADAADLSKITKFSDCWDLYQQIPGKDVSCLKRLVELATTKEEAMQVYKTIPSSEKELEKAALTKAAELPSAVGKIFKDYF